MASNATTSIDIDALLAGDWQQLYQLLQSAYPHNHYAPDQPTLDTEQLISLLGTIPLPFDRSLTDQIATATDQQLATRDYAILRFVDQLFDNYFSNGKLHDHINQQLGRFRGSAAGQLLAQQMPWQQQQALVSILASTYANTIGWQPELGRAADRYMQQFTPLLTALAQAPTASSIESLQAFFDTHQQRTSKLEQRLYDSEVGLLNARHASQLSASTLNKFMAGKQLPADISQFLHGPWRESMRLTVLNKGQQSSDWQQLLRLTETLIWSFQPFDTASAEHSQQVYGSISELSEQLREHTVGLHHSSQLETELAKVEQLHLRILKNQPLEYASFELLECNDPMLNAQISVSNTLVKQATAYDIGQWFLFRQDGGQRRAKLAAKIPQLHLLLFTNLAGVKSHQHSFEEFAYLLSSSQAVAVKRQDHFQATAEKMLRVLSNRQQQQQQQADQDEEQRQQQQRQQAIEKKAAIEKALQEARSHVAAQQAARLKAQQQRSQQLQRDTQQRHEKQALEKLSQLSIGAIVLFYNEERASANCKLATIIQSSGEYIFVNRQGIKQHALTLQQLTDRLLDSTAKIIDQGSNFDNTLEQVVNTIRTRKDYD